MSDRQELTILGRKIGTYDGWDGDMDSMVLYDVESHLFPKGDLSIDYTGGRFIQYDESGEIVQEWDVIDTLKDAPKSTA